MSTPSQNAMLHPAASNSALHGSFDLTNGIRAIADTQWGSAWLFSLGILQDGPARGAWLSVKVNVIGEQRARCDGLQSEVAVQEARPPAGEAQRAPFVLASPAQAISACQNRPRAQR